MAFGIGTNTESPRTNKLIGEQREIACQCWYTKSGKETPLMIKIEDEDGEIRTIKQIQVLSQERKNFCGIPAEYFDCVITILGKQMDVQLIHYLTESRWVLNFK